MKKEQVLIGLGVATAIVTAFNGHVQADEVTNKQSNKTTVSQSETKKDVEVSESDVKNAEVKTESNNWGRKECSEDCW